MNRKIVFLHIPKTAGQAIHAELERLVGRDKVSPVRVHTQVAKTEPQMPAGYDLYSGHIDWTDLETVPEPRFVFTVLRDPLERIASFYFYLKRQAAALDPEELKLPHRTGMRMVVENDAAGYFMSGNAGWQRFVEDHYRATYCAYLVSRKMRGWSEVKSMPVDELVARAIEAAGRLDAVYSTEELDRFETDIEAQFGTPISVTARFVNAAPEARTESRWQKLEAVLEDPAAILRLRQFAYPDQVLMHRLGLAPAPAPVEGLPDLTC